MAEDDYGSCVELYDRYYLRHFLNLYTKYRKGAIG